MLTYMPSLITTTAHGTFYVIRHRAGGFWDLVANGKGFMLAHADPGERAVSYIFMVAHV